MMEFQSGPWFYRSINYARSSERYFIEERIHDYAHPGRNIIRRGGLWPYRL